MNWLKNILVIIALFVAAMPCTHADLHAHAHERADIPVEISESHHCACHSCEEVACTEDIEVQQRTFTGSTPVAYPAPRVLLFVFTETKPVVHQVSSTVADPLNALRTIQLLI